MAIKHPLTLQTSMLTNIKQPVYKYYHLDLVTILLIFKNPNNQSLLHWFIWFLVAILSQIFPIASLLFGSSPTS